MIERPTEDLKKRKNKKNFIHHQSKQWDGGIKETEVVICPVFPIKSSKRQNFLNIIYNF